MFSLLYHIGLKVYEIIIHIVSFWNQKAKDWRIGRAHWRSNYKIEIVALKQPRIWFHISSLGEFEQAKQVIEHFSNQPQYNIIITFFSPSGYNIRNNTSIADGVFYLPLDTKKNAKDFIDLVQPEIAVFVKYDIWPNYWNTLAKKNIPIVLFSSIFRENQIYFQWYGSFFRNALKHSNSTIVQNKKSKDLLEKIGMNQIHIGNDTRFDQVLERRTAINKHPLIQSENENKTLVAGSTWPQDDDLMIQLFSEQEYFNRLIIAPHEMNDDHIQYLDDSFTKNYNVIRLTHLLESEAIEPFEVLIVDNIGHLSSLYQYANCAYIGGGFGVGIHNILEAAVYEIPVIFGPKYAKFQEAKDLIELQCAQSISNFEELKNAVKYYSHLDQNKVKVKVTNYFESKRGGSQIVTQEIEKLLSASSKKNV